MIALKIPGDHRLAILAFMIFVFLTGPAAAQIVPGEGTDSGLGGGNIVMGTVYTSTGQRVASRVKIRLTTMTRGDRLTSSDENGNFVIRGLVSGNYSIVIDEKEFEPYSQAVDIIQFRGSPAQTVTLNIRLIPKKGPDQKTGVVDAAAAMLDDQARTDFAASQQLAKSGDHKGAIEKLLVLTNGFPTFMQGFNDLGVEYLRTGDLEKAHEAFLAAIKLRPDAFAPLMNDGIVLYQMRKFEEAEIVLRAAVKTDKESPAAHYFLGQSVANLGKFEEAEVELVFALKSKSENMYEAHRTLAIIYSARNDRKNALIHLEAYVKLVPTAPDIDRLKATIIQLKQH